MTSPAPISVPDFNAFPVWGEAREVPIELLILTSWNFNEMEDREFAELTHEIETNKFDEPCQIVAITKGENAGHFLVLGGEHRYKVLAAAGADTVPCVLKERLDPEDEAELMEWSGKRNNIRGKINAQKFAEFEQKYMSRKKISAETARQKLLVRGQALKGLRKTGSIRENEDDSTDKGGRKKQAENKNKKSSPATDGERDKIKTAGDRRNLLSSLRAFEQDVLIESGDTVEHGYLWFGQAGKNHLVVEESVKLYALVKQMVAACKNDSAKIDDFLTGAISTELKQWES